MFIYYTNNHALNQRIIFNDWEHEILRKKEWGKIWRKKLKNWEKIGRKKLKNGEKIYISFFFSFFKMIEIMKRIYTPKNCDWLNYLLTNTDKEG